MSSSKIIRIERKELAKELTQAHMQGYSQGLLKGLELAEALTKIDLSEAKKVVIEESQREGLNNGQQEDHKHGRTAGAVDEPGPGSGRSPDAADQP